MNAILFHAVFASLQAAPTSLEVPSGWTLCGTQPEGVEKVDANHFRAQPYPSEQGDDYVVYVRATKRQPQGGTGDCDLIAVTVDVPDPSSWTLSVTERELSGDPRWDSLVETTARSSQRAETLVFVVDPGVSPVKIKLPSGTIRCPGGEVDVALEVDEETPATVAPSVAACGGGRNVLLKAVANIRPPDAANMALEWLPTQRLLRVIVRGDQVPSAPLLAFGLTADGATRLRCDGGLCSGLLRLGEFLPPVEPVLWTMPAGVAETPAGRRFDAAGAPYVPQKLVSKQWMVSGLADSERVVMAQDIEGTELLVRMPETPLRFFVPTCKAGSLPVSCGRIDLPPSIRLPLKGADGDPIRKQLKDDKGSVTISYAPSGSMPTLISRDWSEISAKTVKQQISVFSCDWKVEQLTPLFTDLTNARVVLRVSSVQPAAQCPLVGEWPATTATAAVGAFKVSSRLSVLPSKQTSSDGPRRALAVLLVEATGPVADDFAVKIDNLPDVLLSVQPAPVLLPIKVWTELDPPLGVEAAGPTKRRMTPHEVIALDRATFVQFHAGRPELWSLEVTGQTARPCHPLSRTSARGNPRLPFRERVVCLEGLAASEAPVSLIAELRAPPLQLLQQPGTPLTADERTTLEQVGPLGLGARQINLRWKVSQLRLALPLHQLLTVECPNAGLSSERRQGIRAVTLGGLMGEKDCSLHVSTPEGRSIDSVLREFGPQRLRVSLRLSKDDGETWETPIDARGGDFRLLAGSARETYPLYLHELKLEDYELIEVTITNAELTGVANADDPDVAPYKFVLRKMPAFLAARLPGLRWGPRVYGSLVAPSGLLRTANPGATATQSSDYLRWQPAVIGAAVVLVAEMWDFDRNVAALPLNPQIHVGALISGLLDAAGVAPPRFSGVVGIGVRLPGSTSTTSAVEISSGFLAWVEFTNDARSQVFVDFLLGYRVNFGSLGN